jgi:hypothetical protein
MFWVGIKDKSNPRDMVVFVGENKSRTKEKGI